MTEAEWLAYGDSEEMREHITFTDRRSERKAALWFAARLALADNYSTGRMVAAGRSAESCPISRK